MKLKPIINILLASGLGFTAIALLKPPSSGIEAFSPSNFCQAQLHGNQLNRTELLFGLSKSNGSMVTEKEFQRFMDQEVTPLFPNGLTVITAAGQFKDPNAQVIKEPSKVLLLLYPFDSESNRRIEHIRAAYRSKFQQQSVLRTDARSCVSF
ncbi:DUF3574 domain-containing protein [Leptolyngbya sp. NIES-2104]|uniref:DUF3574 domain-containing protein n=1 Tax=Leptolyngbya sp. NIES-2104 TaxID=1552121 RepID=UPI0006EC4CAB|nr:DUF3574 domain-containing protein [Leptolyngbya sp. NIES-2104]GAP94194.1 hypothetical protein NIES2104_07050 [Leptolyngbya sp. NIES-2104]